MTDIFTRAIIGFLRWQQRRSDRKAAARTNQALMRANPQLRQYEEAIEKAKRLHRPTRSHAAALRDAKTAMLKNGRI